MLKKLIKKHILHTVSELKPFLIRYYLWFDLLSRDFFFWKDSHPYIYRLIKICGKWSFRATGYGLFLELGQHGWIIYKHHDKLDIGLNFILNSEMPNYKKIIIGTAIVIGTGGIIYGVHKYFEYYKNKDVRFFKENFDKVLTENSKLKAKLKDYEFVEVYALENEAKVHELIKEKKELQINKGAADIKSNFFLLIIHNLHETLLKLKEVQIQLINQGDVLDTENKKLKTQITKQLDYIDEQEIVATYEHIALERKEIKIIDNQIEKLTGKPVDSYFSEVDESFASLSPTEVEEKIKILENKKNACKTRIDNFHEVIGKLENKFLNVDQTKK